MADSVDWGLGGLLTNTNGKGAPSHRGVNSLTWSGMAVSFRRARHSSRIPSLTFITHRYHSMTEHLLGRGQGECESHSRFDRLDGLS